MTTFAKN
jgi:hypothetical protein